MIRARTSLLAFVAAWAAAATAAAAAPPEARPTVKADLPACLPIPCSLPTKPGRAGLLSLSGTDAGRDEPGQEGLTEVISFSFDDIEVEYTSQGGDGFEGMDELKEVGEGPTSNSPAGRNASKPVSDSMRSKLFKSASLGRTLTMMVPAGTCISGARYPAVTLRSDNKVYELRDVRVASCAPAARKSWKPSQRDDVEYMKVRLKHVIVSG